ncbi:MAG: DoxX family membrane protein [Candidatus Eisenbacteria bacterium]|uniref:DoxX family membrane protein n=1 Tax=Eiseniibacteriota bacterium TaxID=2212470 RepID=A0A937XA09_UNCEI|nr:DoxX family membrane protein [Candidatus Eisenbacteria bacterium]
MTPYLPFAALTLLALLLAYGVAAWAARHTAGAALGLWLAWACRVALAAVFLLAAYGKILDPYALASSIYAYRVVPAGVAIVTGVVMPALEIVAALALLSGLLWRGGAVVFAAMLAVFIAGLFQAIVRGIDIDCGCFGKESSPVSFWLIARNYGLILLALFPLARDVWRERLGFAPRRRGTRFSRPRAAR